MNQVQQQGMGGVGRGRFWSYPHPFMDLSSFYVPKSVKELYKWALHLFLSHSEISSTIKNKCAYAQTELIYGTEDERSSRVWRQLLEGMDYEKFEYMLLLDLEVYGNAFSTIVFPKDRYMKCDDCSKDYLLEKCSWRYESNKFFVRCPKCGSDAARQVYDRKVRNRGRVRLKRWNPADITVRENPFTAERSYFYNVPKSLVEQLKEHKNGANKHLVDGTPLSFLKAIAKNEMIRFSPGVLNHISEPSASMDGGGLGIPPLLAVFKDAWLFQVYKRAQEAVAMEHVLPMRVLSPSVNNSGASPHGSIDLAGWTGQMHSMVRSWRRDQNAVFTSPFPIDKTEIGGESARLNVTNELQFQRNNIIQGLQVPPTIANGEASWSGSSVSLRILENLYLVRIKGLDKFLRSFLVPRLCAYFDLPKIEIHHRSFKMADDPQRQQIFLSLRGQNVISDQTMLEEMGIDASKEHVRKIDETQARRTALAEQITEQAKAQGQATVLNAKYSALAQLEEQRVSADASKDDAEQEYKQLLNGEPGLTDRVQSAALATTDPTTGSPIPAEATEIWNSMADDVLATTGPDTYDKHVKTLDKSNPYLAKVVRQRKTRTDKATAYSLPEQKPPRGKGSGF